MSWYALVLIKNNDECNRTCKYYKNEVAGHGWYEKVCVLSGECVPADGKCNQFKKLNIDEEYDNS